MLRARKNRQKIKRMQTETNLKEINIFKWQERPPCQQTDKKWRIAINYWGAVANTMHYSFCISQMKSSICQRRNWQRRGFVIMSVLHSRGSVLTNIPRHVFARMIADCPSKADVATICSPGLVVPDLITWPHVHICLCTDLHVHQRSSWGCFISFAPR